MAREINLVPDIKGEMVKALKLRNFIFFLCIVIASASVAVVLVVGSIAGGQQAIADGKKDTLTALSTKINTYSGLSNFLTVRDQLSNLSSIASNKKLLSRTFNILSALLPHGADTIVISELNIDLSDSAPTLSFDAQANAGEPPYFDYRVQDAFVKSMEYMRYDYGDYVDRDGNTIPAYCIVESDATGTTLSDPEKGYYAYWLINGEGCNPSAEDDSLTDSSASAGYTTESYGGQTVVRIWRTPQFNLWYGRNQITTDGYISGVEHFESRCITYTGTQNEVNNEISWTSTNDSCLLVPDGVEGITISDSSNGRDANEELVLRFSATITLSPDAYSFANHHVLAFGPTARYNVTDSYVQIKNMFGKRATDCAEGDTACASKENKGEK